MWAANKLLLGNNAYINDLSGDNLELDQFSFVGLTVYSLIIRFVFSLLGLLDPFNIGLEASMLSEFFIWFVAG